jgi:multiple sugar transport system permease protein/putative chitobiose transport system permease protein
MKANPVLRVGLTVLAVVISLLFLLPILWLLASTFRTQTETLRAATRPAGR